MRQIVFKSGKALSVNVPTPQLQPKYVLVNLEVSCISPGTEMAGLNASAKTLWKKAKENPEKVKAAFKRMKTSGVFSVLTNAQAKIENEGLCGYSAAGIVKEIGSEVIGFSKGMRVAVAGAGYANHAEQVVVPVNLTIPMPEEVSFEDASTCALGGIALQGIRRADVSLGDFVVVTGCGAIGLLTVQMLKAAGCRVIGIDLDDTRLSLAKDFGAELTLNPEKDDVVRKVIHITNGQGADRVILTVATSSSEPVQQAFEMSRRKGKVVLVGVVGMELERSEMYKKELDFVISTSYGPGRYDQTYENNGIDYPYSYVRWTEQRNMQAYLHLLAAGSVNLDRIIAGSFPVNEAEKAYQVLNSNQRPLLVLFNYSHPKTESETNDGQPLLVKSSVWGIPDSKRLRVGLVGTGAFMQAMHIPHLRVLKKKFDVCAVCDQNAITARKAARLFPDSEVQVLTEYRKLLELSIDMVLIGTRHNSHASLTVQALEAGKAVLVEKPMCITRKDFQQIQSVLTRTNSPYMVGYNRRFAPAVKRIREVTDKRVNPLLIHYTMNGGFIPYDAWVQADEGGGRIIGEACHIFDLFRSLTGSPVVSVSVDGLIPKTASVHSSDNTIITIKYADGSVCSLLYTGLGSKSGPKERMEVFCDEQMLVLEDYVRLNSYGVDCKWFSKKADKGHLIELDIFYKEILKGNRFPIPLEQLEETWLLSRQVADHLTE